MAKSKYKTVPTEVILRYRRAFSLCESLRVLPYRWNHQTGLPEVDDSKKRLRLMHAAGAFQFPLLIFSILRFAESVMSPSWLWTYKIYMIIAMGPHGFVLTFLLSAMFDRDDVVACCSHVIKILRKNARRKPKGLADTGVIRYLPQLLDMLYGTVIFNWWLYVSLVFWRPDSPDIVTSVLPARIHTLLWIRTASAVIYAIYVVIAAFNAYLILTIVMTTTPWVTFCLKNRPFMKNGASLSAVSWAELVLYKDLYRLCAQFTGSVRMLLPSLQILGLTAAIFGTYAAIRLDKVVALFCGFYGLSLTFLTQLGFDFIAQVNVESKLYIQALKRQSGSRASRGIVRRQLAAMRPMKVQVGRLYCVDKGLLLTMVKIIMENTVNVLLIDS